MTVLAGPRWVGVVTWPLAGFTLLVLVAALVLLGLDGSSTSAVARIGLYCAAAVAVVIYAGVGHLIASRRPDNVIGWLLCLVGLALAATMLCEQYALRRLAVAPGSLPAAEVAGWLSQATFVLTFAPLLFVVLLFPDGRLPSRRWRPVLWVLIVVVLSWAAQLLQAGTNIVGGMSNALSDAGVAYPNPFGVLPRHGWFSGYLQVVIILALVTTVVVVISVFVRRRGAGAELRQQLAWLGYVGVLTVVVPGALLIGSILFTGGHSSVLGELFWGTLIIIPMVGIPLACAVAVLKYRLYDLDVVVKKTVVAGVVAAAFTVIYALVVVAVGAVTGRPGSSALTFIAAVLAAVALQPVRARAGLLADRLVYGRRASPYEVLSEFAGRIAGTYSTEEVLPAMARMLTEATGAERAEVWLRSGEAERIEAAWPAAAEPAPAVRRGGARRPDPGICGRAPR